MRTRSLQAQARRSYSMHSHILLHLAASSKSYTRHPRFKFQAGSYDIILKRCMKEVHETPRDNSYINNPACDFFKDLDLNLRLQITRSPLNDSRRLQFSGTSVKSRLRLRAWTSRVTVCEPFWIDCAGFWQKILSYDATRFSRAHPRQRVFSAVRSCIGLGSKARSLKCGSGNWESLFRLSSQQESQQQGNCISRNSVMELPTCPGPMPRFCYRRPSF